MLASITILGLLPKTLFLYFSVCFSKSSIDGIETTFEFNLYLFFKTLDTSNPRLTSEPVDIIVNFELFSDFNK